MSVEQQPQNSSFAKKLGGRVARANAQHADAPIDTGNRWLPAGINNGIAKLSSMYTKVQENDTPTGKTPKGETFFRASAVVEGYIDKGELHEYFKGDKISGMVTSQVVPLCDSPATAYREVIPFEANWFDFQNLFKLLSNGSMVCRENETTDPTGEKTQAFYFACMKQLTDPSHPPVYIQFTTRGFTPEKKPGQKEPSTEIVMENWHGLAKPEHVAMVMAKNDPAAQVTRRITHTHTDVQPAPNSPPPEASTGTSTVIRPAPNTTQIAQVPSEASEDVDREYPPQGSDERVQLVAELLEILAEDPDLHTDEGRDASVQLEDMAFANGWSEQDTTSSVGWEAVAGMALDLPGSSAVTANGMAPAVGSKWLFARRKADGTRLKDNKGNELAAQEVEVVSVDVAAKTCTVKTTKDGKMVVNMRDKKPVAVKWEWLEQF
jgi:hypothetical protein